MAGRLRGLLLAVKPLCASLSSRDKPDDCFVLLSWWLFPNSVSFHYVVAQCPAEMGSDLALWEQHPCLEGPWKKTANSWLAGEKDRDGTGLARGQKERIEEQWVHLGWQVTHLYGEELGEVRCAFLATRPALDTRIRQAGQVWAILLGTRSLPAAAAPLTFSASWKMGTPG